MGDGEGADDYKDVSVLPGAITNLVFDGITQSMLGGYFVYTVKRYHCSGDSVGVRSSTLPVQLFVIAVVSR